jgi:hypothetical protein
LGDLDENKIINGFQIFENLKARVTKAKDSIFLTIWQNNYVEWFQNV